ncbi:hypothetical protein F3Y22_tig00111662pilonHSYRG00162 [Hibiscus syriacus]|uniref:Uncharacterized protein n=1 Tax=Hibiscus syriacus TaxID=106335 RepID=A0A6A2YFP2_HIBSY|nr:hypothetical protein F3Y22_tig00111662pilonHSYRG00162 [Hibiscus syriacus]
MGSMRSQCARVVGHRTAMIGLDVEIRVTMDGQEEIRESRGQSWKLKPQSKLAFINYSLMKRLKGRIYGYEELSFVPSEGALGGLIAMSDSKFLRANKKTLNNRFLISPELLASIPNLKQSSLPKSLSDHNCVLLNEEKESQLKSSFKWSSHWTDDKGYSKLVQSAKEKNLGEPESILDLERQIEALEATTVVSNCNSVVTIEIRTLKLKTRKLFTICSVSVRRLVVYDKDGGVYSGPLSSSFQAMLKMRCVEGEMEEYGVASFIVILPPIAQREPIPPKGVPIPPEWFGSENSSAAWLSSARVVRCLVKSYNERNPRFVLLRHAHKEKVFATEVTTTSSWRRRKTRHSGEPPGGVEGGDDVKSAWPLWAGPHTCYNGNYNGKQGCKVERIRKDCLSSDCSLQLGNMKLESLVIADQHAAVNMYPGPVHTAHHTLGIGFARSIGPMITHDFCVPLVPQSLLVVLLAHTTVGSSTGVKS